jgi:hypothetical protein
MYDLRGTIPARAINNLTYGVPDLTTLADAFDIPLADRQLQHSGADLPLASLQLATTHAYIMTVGKSWNGKQLNALDGFGGVVLRWSYTSLLPIGSSNVLPQLAYCAEWLSHYPTLTLLVHTSIQ